MEIDLIFLPRNKEMTIQDIEKDFTQIINTMFTNVSDTSFDVTTTSSNVCNYKVDYKYKVEKDRILYIKIQSDLSEMKSAELLDLVANKITKGSHRKNFDIITSYNEPSLVFCNKLMPLFGEYERRLRQILYITLVKAFQVDWLNQSFQKTLLDDITTRDNKNKLIENALEELTYEQLKTFLFVPFTLVNFEQVLESSLSETEMQKKSKDEIIEIINSCRKNSLWNMFFKTDKSLLSIPDDIEDYQKFRNKVMHNKYISYKEFNCIRKRLKKTNTKLKEAIIKLDASIYNKHETDAVLTIFNAKILEGICEAFSGYSASMKTLSEVFSNAIRSYWTISENLDLGFLSELSNRMNNSLEPLRKSFSVK